MNTYYRTVTILTILLVCLFLSGFTQPYTLEVDIKNQPDNPIVIGTIHGDRFLPIDTLKLQPVVGNMPGQPSGRLKKIRWQFPGNTLPGMYRLVFGQTVYARVMNEAPQQLDFIFNNENIILETNFTAPQDSLLVVLSEENRVWFGFLREEKKLREMLDMSELELDYFQTKIATAKASPEPVLEADMQRYVLEASQKSNAFNQLQIERERLISSTESRNRGLFATLLIGLSRKPLRDGSLSQHQRKEIYQQEYFHNIDFTDESLIRTPVLTDKIFDYLASHNHPSYTHEQREQTYIVAVTNLMSHIEPTTGENHIANPVYEFVLDYIVNGFKGLNMNKVLAFITENYAVNL
jgi:hypothetical protein